MIAPINNLPKITGDTAFIRIASLYETYNGVLPNVRFFEQTVGDTVTAVISKYDGVTNLWADDNADYEELKYFIFSLVGRLFCESGVLEKLELGLPSVCGDILRLETPQNMSDERFITTPDIRSLHTALKNDFTLPDFESFYADIFYRRKVDNVRFATFQQDGITIANAMTVAESEDRAIIGGVYTDEGHRGQKLGLSAVNTICKALKNKTVFVYTRKPELYDFYKNMGFVKHGIWTETEINYE